MRKNKNLSSGPSLYVSESLTAADSRHGFAGDAENEGNETKSNKSNKPQYFPSSPHERTALDGKMEELGCRKMVKRR